MSLQTEAETLADLASKIVRFAILQAQIEQGSGARSGVDVVMGGTAIEVPPAMTSIELIPGMAESAVPISDDQKTTLFSQIDGWKADVKKIVESW